MSNPSQPKTWRDVLPVHPAAELFPRMSESELHELGEDIRANKLQFPIATWFDPEAKIELLVDGRNRLDAMELVGLPTAEIISHRARLGTCIDPWAFVVAANIKRRHLTSEQKRDLIAKLIKQTPNKSDRQIAKQTKTSPTTVGTIRKKAEATGDVSKVDTRTDSRGRKQPSTKPKKSSKPTSPEAPTTSIPAKSQRGVSARDIALEDFGALAMELDRLTRNKSAARFAKTSVSDEVIRHLAKLFSDLINIRNEKVVDRICGSAEISTEQRKAEHAALDGAAS